MDGLGSNVCHSKDFLQELDSKACFLNPYEKYFRDEIELKSWFKKEIVEEESICLMGHSLGEIWLVISHRNFKKWKNLILLDGGYLDLDRFYL